MARRPFRGARSAPRLTDWFFIDESATTLATASSSALIGQLNAAGLAMRPFTVIRTYLDLLLISDQVAASEFQQAAIGMAVVSDQAIAIGITAVPTPFTDAGSDLWFVHQFMSASFLFASGVGFDGSDGRGYNVDSKAMRKVNADQDLAIVIERSSLGAGVDVIVAGRFLVKLH